MTATVTDAGRSPRAGEGCRDRTAGSAGRERSGASASASAGARRRAGKHGAGERATAGRRSGAQFVCRACGGEWRVRDVRRVRCAIVLSEARGALAGAYLSVIFARVDAFPVVPVVAAVARRKLQCAARRAVCATQTMCRASWSGAAS